jgi:hypothetical protein
MIWSFGEVLEFFFPRLHLRAGRRYRRRNLRRTAADQSRRSEGKRPLDLFLKIGDVVEVSSPQIGALSNQIVMSESE